MTEATGAAEEGNLLWEPSSDLIENGNITRYMQWLASERSHGFDTYDQLWQWSVDDIEAF